MGNGVINTPSGAHEHQTNVASGLVNKDKSTYTQQSVELYYERELLRKKKKSATDNGNSAYEEHYNVQRDSQYTDSTIDVSGKNNGAQTAHQNNSTNIAYLNNANSPTRVNASNSEQRSELPISQQYYEDLAGEDYSRNYSETTQVVRNQTVEAVVSRNNNSTNNAYLNNANSPTRVNASNSEQRSELPISQQYYEDLAGEDYSGNYSETTQVVRNQTVEAVVSSNNNSTNNAYKSSENSSAEGVVSNSVRYSKYVKYTDVTESTAKNKSVKHNSNAGKFGTLATSTAKAVSTGTSYLAESQSYQNDEGAGEAAAHKLENATKSTVKKVDKLTNSRYFKFSGKASDSVKVSRNSGRFVAAASTMKKLGKKGVSAVDNVLVNPMVRVAGDDVGSQTVVKMIETSRDVYKVGKTSAKYGYKTTKTMYKAGRNTAKYSKKAAQTAYKYTRQAVQTTVKATTKAAQTTAKVAVVTAKTVASVIAKAIAFIIANPLAFFIALIILVVVMIILMFGSFMGGATEYASYEGAGNSATMTVNNYSAIYDYTNKAIAKRCLDLFNLQDTWTGFLEYHYKYKIEKDDGTYINSTTYPIADVAPIMAYLSVNYQSYTLTDDVKTEIDNIVHNLYTFDYQIESCTHTVDHGSGNIEYIYGQKVTYTITYHNAAKFFEENGYIASEKMAAYNAVKSYGDISYFRMYNLFGDKNWHEWISEQYGYSVVAKYNYNTEKYEYEMIELDYCTLEYRNKDNETAPNLYSPINGKVTSITETDDYDKVITIKDSTNNLEFTIMVEFEEYINMMVNQGDTVVAGQQIATRNYSIDIKCKSDGNKISPMLIMEYFQHAN